MGPHMLFNLGSGGRLEVFCEFQKKLADGVHAEEDGRSFNELAMERDEKIVAVLKAMKEVNKRQNKGDKQSPP